MHFTSTEVRPSDLRHSNRLQKHLWGTGTIVDAFKQVWMVVFEPGNRWNMGNTWAS